jgi:acyl-coenzyme A thioesterase PaaI-like protein
MSAIGERTAAAPGRATTSRDASVGARLRARWERLAGLPGGTWLFSVLVGWMAPYTGTIGARVVDLAPGRAKVAMRDRRRVRNHLRSIHAIALLNLAEEASGLAITSGMPEDLRGILRGLSIEYLKKARGTITAESTAPVPETGVRREYEVPVELTDAAGEVVARAHALWLIGPAA